MINEIRIAQDEGLIRLEGARCCLQKVKRKGSRVEGDGGRGEDEKGEIWLGIKGVWEKAAFWGLWPSLQNVIPCFCCIHINTHTQCITHIHKHTHPKTDKHKHIHLQI